MTRFFSFTGQFRYYWFTGVAAAAGLAGSRVIDESTRFKQVQPKAAIQRSRPLFSGKGPQGGAITHMIVNMSEKATEQEINHIIERIREAGYQPHVTRGTERTIVAAVGNGRRHEIEALQVAPGVDNVVAIAQPFKLVSRQVKPERTVVNVGGVAHWGPGGGGDCRALLGGIPRAVARHGACGETGGRHHAARRRV